MSHHIQNWEENQAEALSKVRPGRAGTTLGALHLGVTTGALPSVRECRVSSRYIERPSSQTKA